MSHERYFVVQSSTGVVLCSTPNPPESDLHSLVTCLEGPIADS